MKIQSALALALIILGFGAPARADPHGLVRAGDIAPAVSQILSSSEITVMVRSVGFDPITRPVQRGITYVLRAIDPNDVDVRLVVDARTGRILSVSPTIVPTPRYGGSYESPGFFPRSPGFPPRVMDTREPSLRLPGGISPYDDDFDAPSLRPGIGGARLPYRDGVVLPQTFNPRMELPESRTSPAQTPLPRPRPSNVVIGHTDQAPPPQSGAQVPANPPNAAGTDATPMVPVAPLE